MEIEMRGMEYSLVSSAANPIQQLHQQQLSAVSQTLSARIHERIQQLRCYSPFHWKIESDMGNPSPPLEPRFNQGWLCLYVSCIHMFLNDTSCYNISASTKLHGEASPGIIASLNQWIQKLTSYKRLEFAFKCSISLSLAVLLGLTFDKENGCWAGLTIAISFVTGRQAIFTIANSRVQGTALGSVYGVICCFIFHYEELRLLALLPWIIFASFLRYSKMYGQTGGVSAAVGALVILGRKNYGAPNEFAIARLTEVFIGLSAFIFVEVFLQPIRAATLARNHAYLTIHALQDCIKGAERISPGQDDHTTADLKEKQNNLKCLVSELKDYVADAEMEPDFWYFPFRASCYKNLVASLSNILDMLYFITHNHEMLSKLSETDAGSKFKEQISNELQLFQEALGSSCICPEQALTAESRAVMEEEMEAGNLCNRAKLDVLIPSEEEEEDAGDKNLKKMMLQCASAMGFCISSVMKEMKGVEICMREIGNM